MAFTMAAFSESQDTSAVLTEVAALPDQHLTVDGDDILVPDGFEYLMGVFALGANITAARLSSPTLRKRLMPDISPLNVGAEPVSGLRLFELATTPLKLTSGEGLRALVAEDTAGAERETVLVWLGDGSIETVTGPVHTVKLTGTTTLVANAWSLVPLTISQQLEAGTWRIVGMRALSAGAVAARLVIPGSPWRPGTVAYDDEADVEHRQFRHGNYGIWGEFSHSFIPQVEFLSISADTAETVYLDVQKVS